MLKFINDNGVLFSGIFTIIGAILAILATLIKDNKTYKKDTINSLKNKLTTVQKELDETKNKLDSALSIEKAEELIDKTHGSIYYESLGNNGSRPICGFCWEKEHIKMPLNIGLEYDEYTKQQYYVGTCHSCKCQCVEDIDYNETPEEPVNIDGDLQF